MKRARLGLTAPLLLLSVGGFSSPTRAVPVAPSRNANFSSTREVNKLEFDDEGVLWAYTRGGVLRFQKGVWQKIRIGAPTIDERNRKTSVRWQEQNVAITLDGLVIGEGKSARAVPLPRSSGTHISAVLPRGDTLLAALFGDGIWEWDGEDWSKPDFNLPLLAREITALVDDGKGGIWLGTRRQGVWERRGNAWKQHLQPDEPFGQNVQFLQTFQGALWASTLEDGLVVRDTNGWKHFGNEVLSSNAPRQLVVFQNKLYVRHSNEVVDCFDGTRWKKDVFPRLPRRQIISLAADANNLYLGQWGGWSQWNGKTFSHHLKIPLLQIVPLMQIFPDKGKLWLGTENRGLFEWEAKTGRLRQHDERNGLPDDWITTLTRNGQILFAGTFNGGLAWRRDQETQWHSAPQLKRLGITAIVNESPQRTLVATRFGLFCLDEKGHLRSWNKGLTKEEQEIQSLLLVKEGLWIGTRSGLLFRIRATLNTNSS